MIKRSTGVESLKEREAAWYPIFLWENLEEDMTSTTWKAAHDMSKWWREER